MRKEHEFKVNAKTHENCAQKINWRKDEEHWEKSLGSLCNVKIKSHSLTHSLSESVTRSPIELFWTAKKLITYTH